MSGPHVSLPFDPDPLEVSDEVWTRIAHTIDVEDAFESGVVHGRSIARTRLIAVALASICAGILAATVVVAIARAAAPRTPAEPVIPAAVSGADSAPKGIDPASGNLARPASGAPLSGPLSETVDPVDAVGSGAPPITEPDAIAGGIASWCAPTPTHCQSWGGDAHLAAVPSFRFGDQPYRVVVRFDGRSTVVTVVSFCACGDKIIDLSPAAFVELAPLSVGVLRVTVEDVGPGLTAPPTDVSRGTP